MKLPTILAIAAFAASPALAQSTAAIGTDRWTEVEADMKIPGFDKQADMIKNMRVHNADGQPIGDVEDVIGFGENQALAVAVDFDGKHGYPERDDVVVPLAMVAPAEDGQSLVLAATPAEVLAMENYED